MINKAIVIILPRGEAIRNLVYSGVCNELKRQYRVVLISVIPNAQIKFELDQNADEVIELTETSENYKTRILHEILDLAHNRLIWTEASKLRFFLRDRDARGPVAKIKRILKKRIATYFAKQNRITKLAAYFETVAQQDRAASNWLPILKKYTPVLVFNGSHIHNRNSLPVMHAAKLLGLKTATFLFSWDNLTSQGRVIPDYDTYMVWNKRIYSDFLKMYPDVSQNRVAIVGTPQFDFHFKTNDFFTREALAMRDGLDPNRPWVLYTTGMPNHMPFEQELVEILADKLKEMPEKPQLLLRIYPKDLTNRFEDLLMRRPDIRAQKVAWEQNYLTPLPEDLAVYSSTLAHVSAGINVASTVSLELAMFDKPVINLAFNPPSLPESTLQYARYYQFEHYKRLMSYGAISLADSPEKLSEHLYLALQKPSLYREQRKHMIADFFDGLADGKSFERLISSLKKYC